MVLPEKLCGIEIKSDADTYVRLADQVKYYDKYYDENYIVAGSTHAMHVAKHVPEYWGIITVELIKGRVDFYRVREAQPNPGEERHAEIHKQKQEIHRREADRKSACGGFA